MDVLRDFEFPVVPGIHLVLSPKYTVQNYTHAEACLTL